VSVEVQKLLAKSQRSLDAATELVQKEFPEFAVSRAYYAIDNYRLYLRTRICYEVSKINN
jgi:hypothetical protein